jgi:hypothetical protein
MSVPNLYSAGAIVLQNAAMAAPLGFAGLVSEAVELGTQYRTLKRHLSVWDSQASISRQDPAVNFSTTQIKTALDLMGARGVCITSQASPARPGFDAYLSKHDKCNVRDLLNLRRFNFAEGYLFPGQLSVAHGGVATITGTAVASSSTANHPLAFFDDADAPASSVIADTESFGLYNQRVGGIELAGCTNLAIDFGVEVTRASADAAIWPEWISVGAVATRITLSGINPLWLSAAQIPIDGRPLTHANSVLRLGRHETDGTGAWDELASSTHIGITVAGVGAITTAASASDETSPTTTDLVIIALHDGTNDPLVIDTTFALA